MADNFELDALVALTTAIAATEEASTTPDPDQSQRMKANTLARVATPQVEGTLTVRPADSSREQWRDGIERKLLLRDEEAGFETALYRLQPGKGFAPHQHSKTEECWVVQGEILIGDLVAQAGDFHVAYAETAHPPVVARSEALLLLRHEIR